MAWCESPPRVLLKSVTHSNGLWRRIIMSLIWSNAGDIADDLDVPLVVKHLEEAIKNLLENFDPQVIHNLLLVFRLGHWVREDAINAVSSQLVTGKLPGTDPSLQIFM